MVGWRAGLQACRAEDIKPLTGDKTRDILIAMLKHLDLGVGAIVDELEAQRAR